MSIVQKNGAYHVSVQMRGFPAIRRRLDVSTQAEAEQVEAWVKLQLQSGVGAEDLDLTPGPGKKPPSREPRGMTVQEAYDKAMETAWAHSKSRGSFYAPVGAVTVERMGPNLELQHITEDTIRSFVYSCQAHGDSPATINRRLAILSKLWSLAIKKWRVPRVEPIDWGQHRLRVQKGRLRWLTREEERNALHILDTLDMAHAQEMRDFVVLLIDTGVRRGEGLALRPGDVSHDYGSIMVSRSGDSDSTKNAQTRAVPMTKRVRELVSKRLGLPEVQAKGRLFPGLTEARIRRLWDRIRRDMGLQDDPEFVLHACRHTCGTRLIEAGNDIRLVQQWLGHTDIETTTIYAKVTGHHLAKGAASLDELE